MKETIYTNLELCVGCNRCVRECPMEVANITYQDEAGNIKVRIDRSKCVSCGRCVSVCKHNARVYQDDTKLFFNDLQNGVDISLITAPSIRTNMPDYKRLFTYLKKLGVKKIYDVSLGADICIWAHVRYIQKNGPSPIIAQPCPSIVSYCEIYRHELIKRLSPIHSPMACISIYMKKYEGINDRIAAISPCIAKTDEFEETQLAQYNVTFSKLRRYLEENNIKLPEEETGFDHYDSGLGVLFPMPGGLKENIEYHLDREVHIATAEGSNVYAKLDMYAEADEKILPEIFNVVSCDEGCNAGSACLCGRNIFEIDNAVKNSRIAAFNNRGEDYFKSIYKKYDSALHLSSFMREYAPIFSTFPRISDDDIQRAFELMDKTTSARQHVDCGACGCETCYNMARKIALHVNIPVNCIVKAMETAKVVHAQKVFSEQARKAKSREMAVWFATGNAHKKKELAAILEAAIQAHAAEAGLSAAPPFSACELKIPADAGIAFDPVESGSSFRENALIKAGELYALLNSSGLFNPGDAVIADDSGLCVDALGGRPGIYSARYAGPPGRETQAPLCDTERNALLLGELADNTRRGARFVCAMVLLFSPDNFYIAQETLEGSIIESPRGTGGFGYDPLLFIPELGRTAAELSDPEKNRVSHRGKAGRVIARILFG